MRFGEQIAEGKALLETDELVFRGDDGFRLKVPFKVTRSVEVRDGELRIEWPDGKAVFELGAQAEKWAQKILHPKSLLDKLGVKAGMRVLVLGVEDAGFLADLRARVPESGDEAMSSPPDMVLVRVERPEDMAVLSDLRNAIKPAGAVWVVFRKGQKSFNENDVLRLGLESGLVDVKVVRFSDTHTASKFVIRKAERSDRL